MRREWLATILILLLPILGGCHSAVHVPNSQMGSWPFVSGDIGGQRYSSLSDIDKHNVHDLRVAWTYHTGDRAENGVKSPLTAFETAPIVVGDTLYLCSPNNRVIALDPETGREKWHFVPNIDQRGVFESVCRGVAYWHDSQPTESSACHARIFEGTMDGRLIALDAMTGRPCAGFGKDGAIDLKVGIGHVDTGEYYMTSPPLVVHDLVLTGAFVKDVQRIDAPSGAVRAFDARTGALRWVWDPVPPDRRPVTAADIAKGATLTPGTPNVWGIMSADPAQDTVFVGTGNPSPDHYSGPERGEMDHYGSSIVALNSATGAIRWNFQTVHHDQWDYDVAAQPVFFQRSRTGRTPTVVGATKLGFLFLLDARTGKPVFPVVERAVPRSTVPGIVTAPTQPFPTLPAPILPPTLTRHSMWGVSAFGRDECRSLFDKLDYQGPFTPPSLRGTLEYPGLGGGINWGSVSIDPQRQRMIVNVQMAPFTLRLVPRREADPHANGSDLVGFGPQRGTPYAVVRGPFLSSAGRPCVPPPWGRLLAIDLATGRTLWAKTLGTLANNPSAPFVGRFLHWGTPNIGGSLQTGSGLTFIAATMDHDLRAIDGDTGQELWHHELPFAGHGTPVTYKIRRNGRQYVVIAAGGHGALGEATGDALVAFALPD